MSEAGTIECNVSFVSYVVSVVIMSLCVRWVLCGLTPRTDQTCVKAGGRQGGLPSRTPTPPSDLQKPCTGLQNGRFGRGPKTGFLGVQKSALFSQGSKRRVFTSKFGGQVCKIVFSCAHQMCRFSRKTEGKKMQKMFPYTFSFLSTHPNQKLN